MILYVSRIGDIMLKAKEFNDQDKAQKFTLSQISYKSKLIFFLVNKISFLHYKLNQISDMVEVKKLRAAVDFIERIIILVKEILSRMPKKATVTQLQKIKDFEHLVGNYVFNLFYARD